MSTIIYNNVGPTPRVLSIQSHVVSGFVGNKCATFLLQLLGLETDPLYTVNFSNHTGYPHVRGERFTGEQLDNLIQGLRLNNLLQYDYLLVGYVGSPSFLEGLAPLIKSLREQNPKLMFVCDPVLGDSFPGETPEAPRKNVLYVPKEFPKIYREQIVPLADVLVPNQFEIETLTDIQISSYFDAARACRALHSQGVRRVVITSLHFGSSHEIHLFGSEISSLTSGEVPEQFIISAPKVESHFYGTGDAFGALLLVWLSRGENLTRSCTKSLASLQAIVRRTHAAGRKELMLVNSRDEIETPPALPPGSQITSFKG
eukprot:TRINITY_DN13471_c0_g1_i1.p1 TRINITY_DN13471_c0_g1~~TRINITY_DN13471_c0_g1_i1.p1  ORF type:complete len:315 (+),score=54.85 TRINITY_DN13471_c0_g1_i1:79-1023(+)